MDAQLAYAAMAELSEPLRATIVAVDVVGLSYKEAARSLRTRVGTIMSRLYRAASRWPTHWRRHDRAALDRRDQALLVQLADGVLTGAARDRARGAACARSRTATASIERQRRVARALAAGRAARRAPAAAARARRPSRCGWPPPVRWPPRSIAARAADAAGRPTRRSSARGRPRQLPGDPAGARQRPATTLRAEVDGVRFPEWGREFGWHETGMRRDEIDGRRTTTVFYEHMGHRLAYTIVSGPALPRAGRCAGCRARRPRDRALPRPGPRRPRRRRVRARRPDVRGRRARPRARRRC